MALNTLLVVFVKFAHSYVAYVRFFWPFMLATIICISAWAAIFNNVGVEQNEEA